MACGSVGRGSCGSGQGVAHCPERRPLVLRSQCQAWMQVPRGSRRTPLSLPFSTPWPPSRSEGWSGPRSRQAAWQVRPQLEQLRGTTTVGNHRSADRDPRSKSTKAFASNPLSALRNVLERLRQMLRSRIAVLRVDDAAVRQARAVRELRWSRPWRIRQVGDSEPVRLRQASLRLAERTAGPFGKRAQTKCRTGPPEGKGNQRAAPWPTKLPAVSLLRHSQSPWLLLGLYLVANLVALILT